MNLNRRLFLAVATAAAPVWAQAQMNIEGQTFDATARVAGTDLVLNGVGLRAVAWFKGFTAGLYLRSRAATAADVQAVPGAKRLQLRMLQEVPAGEFVKAFKKGMVRNADATELPRLTERMAQFETLVGALGTVRKGDLINLDLEPGRGTLFSVNGMLRGNPISGEDFYDVLLRSFVGEHPYDKKLRAGLLGQRA